MKKILVLLAVAFMGASAGYAQSSIELSKQQRELDKVNMDMLKAKPSKDAKKQAKQRTKEQLSRNCSEISASYVQMVK